MIWLNANIYFQQQRGRSTTTLAIETAERTDCEQTKKRLDRTSRTLSARPWELADNRLRPPGETQDTTAHPAAETGLEKSRAAGLQSQIGPNKYGDDAAFLLCGYRHRNFLSRDFCGLSSLEVVTKSWQFSCLAPSSFLKSLTSTYDAQWAIHDVNHLWQRFKKQMPCGIFLSTYREMRMSQATRDLGSGVEVDEVEGALEAMFSIRPSFLPS